MNAVKDTFTAQGYAAAWSLVKYLPEPVTSTSFATLAGVLTRRQGRQVRQLDMNLNQVAPHGASLQAAVASYLRYWHEVFRLPRWSADRITDGFTLEGKEWLDRHVREGRGAVVVGGHSANWDLAGAWAALRYGTVVSVAERLKPVQLFDQFVAARRSLGIDILGLGDPDIMRALLGRLKAGKIVALLGDRDLSGGGIEVSFFGRTAPVPGGPATLSVLSGAPLHALQLWFDGDMLRGRLSDPIPAPVGIPRTDQVAHMTQEALDFVAAGIAAHPVDWHMMQPIWPGVVAR